MEKKIIRWHRIFHFEIILLNEFKPRLKGHAPSNLKDKYIYFVLMKYVIFISVKIKPFNFYKCKN